MMEREKMAGLSLAIEQDTTQGMPRALAQVYTRSEMMQHVLEFLSSVHDHGRPGSDRIDLLNQYYRDLGLITAFVRNTFPE